MYAGIRIRPNCPARINSPTRCPRNRTLPVALRASPTAFCWTSASGIEQRASRTLVAYGRSGPVASAQTLGNIDKDVGDRSSIPSKALRSHGESSRARHDAGARRAECGAQDRAPFQAACRRAAGAARSRFSLKAQGHLRAWVLLAPAHVQARNAARIEYRVLARKAGTQQAP